MATLNLRDRLIETTIAYIGEGGALNLEHVAKDVEHGRSSPLCETESALGKVLSIDWRPRHDVGLNDCALAVTLVASDGFATSSSEPSVLDQADGVILMVGAAPELAAANERAIERVRVLVERASARHLPVIVQVTDAPADEAAARPPSVGIDAWASVGARLSKGEGVMEALLEAVDGVVGAMQTPKANGAGRAASLARSGANPLLAALRQVLNESIGERVAALEARLVEQLDLRLQASASRADEGSANTVLQAIDARLASLDERVATADRRLTTLLERVTVLTSRLATLEGRVVGPEPLKDDIAGLTAELGRVSERVAALDTRVGLSGSAMADLGALVAHGEGRLVDAVQGAVTRFEGLVSDVQGAVAGTARHQPTRADFERTAERMRADAKAERDGVRSELREHRKGVHEEISRITSSVTALERTLTGLADELKGWNVDEANAGIGSAIDGLGAKSDKIRERIDGVVQELRGTTARVEDVNLRMRAAEATLGRRLSELQEPLVAQGATLEQLVEAIRGDISALTDELKKRKKPWF